jgi:uncharacterized membrane protein
MSLLSELFATFRWIEIVLSPLFISFIPFVLLWTNFGFYYIFIAIPIIGLIIGIYWAERVRKKGNLSDYKDSNLMNTPDLIETWEKEKRQKENNEKL